MSRKMQLYFDKEPWMYFSMIIRSANNNSGEKFIVAFIEIRDILK